MKSAIFMLLLGINASVSIVTSAIMIWQSTYRGTMDARRRSWDLAASVIWSVVICGIPIWLILLLFGFKK